MKIIKKALVILCFIPALVLFVISNNYLYNQTLKDYFEIKDISGNREFMKDITLKGMMTDGTYKSIFSLNQTYSNNNFSKLSYQDIYEYSYDRFHCYYNFKAPKERNQEEGTEQKPYTKADIICVVKDQYDFGYPHYIETDITYVSDLSTMNKEDQQDFKSRLGALIGITNMPEYGKSIVRRDDVHHRAYAFTYTDPKCVGFGGAYDITELLEKNKEKPPKSQKPTRLENLAPIDLEGGRIKIFGMEVVNNRLLFLIAEDNNILLRPFDLNLHKFLPDISLECENIEMDYSMYSYFGESDEKYISILLPLTEKRGDGEVKIIKNVVYDGEKNMLVMNDSIVDKKGDFKYDSDSGVEVIMKYKNNQLYVVTSFDVFREEEVDDHTRDNLNLIVFSGNGVSYQGEVLSGVEEDAAFGVNPYYKPDRWLSYRSYYNLSLE